MKAVKNLKNIAKENTNIKTKNSDGEHTVKKGVPLDHSNMHEITSDASRIGVNIGCTLNMDNYESMRIDCWLTDNVASNETVEQAFERVKNIVQEQVETMASEYKD